MKIKFLLYCLILLIFSPLNAQQDDTLKILFIGNSYTYYNSLPQIFLNLSESGGKSPLVDNSTVGGYSLELHCSHTPTLDKILQRNWDFVVLQEQSQIPTISYYRYNSMYPSARILDSIISIQGSATAFFMTWGRKYGGQQWINGYSSPDFVDFYHMQDTLRSAYTEIAVELSAELISVGMAWGLAFSQDSTVDLWQGDNSHPTLKGSYLTACVFYSNFFNESPEELSYTAGLNPIDAAFLQSIAYQSYLNVENIQMDDLQSSYRLYQNYPNPFITKTTIKYYLPTNKEVIIKIYNILGCEIRTLVNNFQFAGFNSVIWDGKDNNNHLTLPGVYIYRIQCGNYRDFKKLILLN